METKDKIHTLASLSLRKKAGNHWKEGSLWTFWGHNKLFPQRGFEVLTIQAVAYSSYRISYRFPLSVKY
jgi:hypothetical protein